MTLFLVDWADRASLLIDDENELQARAVAFDVSKIKPSRVRALPPRVFVAEVFPDDGADGDVLAVEALPHVADAILELLDDDEGDAPAALRLVSSACVSEADDPDGKVVACEGKAGHAGPHSCGSLTWAAKS